MQKKSGIMKSGLDAMPLFLLDDLLNYKQLEYYLYKKSIEDLQFLDQWSAMLTENNYALNYISHLITAA